AGFKTMMAEGVQHGAARIQVLGEDYVVRLREPYRLRPYKPENGEKPREWDPEIVQERGGSLVLRLGCVGVSAIHRSWKDSTTRSVEVVLGQVVRFAIRKVQDARRLREERRVRAERRAQEEKLRREREEERRREEGRLRIEQQRV